MRFYTQQPRFYAGIDLHARTMHVCGQGDSVIFRWEFTLSPYAWPLYPGFFLGIPA